MSQLLKYSGFLLFLILCLHSGSGIAEEDFLQRIKQSGKIRVITENNPYCYYSYRDEKMGFEYDLAKAFSEYLGVKLELVIPEREDLITALNSCKGDFIAANLAITPSREDVLDFSDSYFSVQQQVIVHADNSNITKVEDLTGKTIHVGRNTTYETRLNDLRKEVPGISVRLYDEITPEELIRMVAENKIDATVVDSNIARLNMRYYPDIIVAFPVEEAEDVSWAVKKGETALLNKINDFFESPKGETARAEIHEEYYSDSEIFDFSDLKEFLKKFDAKFPKYKGIVKKAAKQNDFDWRLIAALIYQDSRFNPLAKTYPRTEGLMQLTSETAGKMEIKDRLNPEQSIMGGTKYLRQLYGKFENVQASERVNFALASYSVGLGHVLDAQKIAGKKGLNPNSWLEMEKVLPLLRHPRYYHDTEYGYCRGTEAIRFIEHVMKYYDQLRNY